MLSRKIITREIFARAINHELTDLIVMDAHKEIKHCGERHTLSEVRNQHWIQRGKIYINKVLYKCINYRKFNSHPYNYPRSEDLPSIHLHDDISFHNNRIDYSGSLYCNVFISDSTDLLFVRIMFIRISKKKFC